MQEISKINKPKKAKRILVAPLDWGLGHATRCIPIIRKLSEHGFEVIIAAETGVAVLLAAEFPNLTMVDLQGYRVRYSRKASSFGINILWQLPRLLRCIRRERKWLQEVANQYEIDGVISDNRFGLSHKNLPTAFITHQLAPQTGFHFLNSLARKINYHYINRFDVCWVPDRQTEPHYSGALAHPHSMPAIPVRYLGVLSRLNPSVIEKRYDLCVLISGPEPQRIILENQLINALQHTDLYVVMVRGLPGATAKPIANASNLTIHNHLPAEALNRILNESAIVLSRTGYTTVMDLAVLGRKAILIPTPGQPEQLHIGSHLKNNPQFVIASQNNFDLQLALQTLAERNYHPQPIDSWDDSVVLDWANAL